MKCRYKITKETVLIDGYNYTSYGIVCKKGVRTVAVFNDISLNINQIEQLCDFLNTSEISSVHFFDIIEDYLAK